MHSLQIIDLADARLKPAKWDQEEPPPNANYQHFADMSVYELHIRDFSMSDPDVPEEHKGKYTAFSLDTHGTRHLEVCFIKFISMSSVSA